MLEKPVGIPRSSGCYLFRNSVGTVIYVGKAKSLANRLGSYFQKFESLDVKTKMLMTDATSVEWIVTPTELDALTLENELIKSNLPRYNIRLKDDKSYPYVAVDVRSTFPVPVITRSSHTKGVKYFGPFVNIQALRATYDELLQAFPVRSCNSHKFNAAQRSKRPCLLFDIGKCTAPCVGAVSEADYRRNIEAWTSFLDGDVKQLREILVTQMTDAASSRHYEAAARSRDGIDALERALASQHVIVDDVASGDVVAIQIAGGRSVVVRFRVRHGRVIGRTVHYIDRSMDESESQLFELVLPSLYRQEDDIPPVVVLANELPSFNLAEDYLSQRRGSRVHVSAPRRGKWRKILDLARGDALALLDRDSHRRAADHNIRSRALSEIGEALGLVQPPYRMECFDMSHLQGTNYVGSMVVFEDGLPSKSHYRHFNVKDVIGSDDVGAMREVVGRRLAHWMERDGRFPRADLIVIDGGLPQLHAAQLAAQDAGVTDVEFVALAKREELLYRPGSSVPIALPAASEALYMMQRLRDEAHRFAISFHRSKRGKSMIDSVLDGIEGLGPKRRAQLLNQFGSLDAIRELSIQELRDLRWLPPQVAEVLYDRLHQAPAAAPSKDVADD